VVKRGIDLARVRAAVEAAERATSGQIVVSVSRWFWGSVERNARRAFERLGVAHTHKRNGVLLFVVPARRRLVVLGDDGIHAKVGQEFWNATVFAIVDHFRAGEPTAGVVHGVELIGAQLAAHFPHTAEDTNELPDEPEAR
jgi:uncharacterized membrane protein